MVRRLLPLILLAGICACGFMANSGQGTVSGTVVGWPAAPLGGDTVPARGAVVRFLDGSDNQIATATTDQSGRYAVSIRPGHYRVSVRAFGFDSPIIISANGKDSKTTPVYIDVAAGGETRLDLVLDTGIR